MLRRKTKVAVEKFRVRKPYSRWIDEVRTKGYVPKIPVGDGLYLKRIKELRGVVNVNSVRRNQFSLSLGRSVFKPIDETRKYKIYQKMQKHWSDLLK